MEETYKWKIPKYKASAEEAYKEISSLADVTPQNIVELARNENSAIHNDFEWNDTIAGEKYRHIQAREMIQLLVIEPVKKEQQPVRVFQITTQRNTYQPTKLILRNEDEYQSLLNRIHAELEAIQKRIKGITEYEPVYEAIEKVL